MNIIDYQLKPEINQKQINPETIPSEINNGGIIKVYYILDDGQTMTLTYTVNYYKDGNLVKEDTETIYETKQVLESDTLTVKSEKINIKDKYVGYKFVKTNPELIPEVIETKGVIDYDYDEMATNIGTRVLKVNQENPYKYEQTQVKPAICPMNLCCI